MADNWNKRVLESIIQGKDKPSPAKRVRKAGTQYETDIQQSCITWFRYQYMPLWEDGVLFHIPNEGLRFGATGRRMKCEGIVRGVADLCLAVARRGFNALYIEMKRQGGRQSEFQMHWERGVTKHGNKYVVCKSLEEFKEVVNWYLA